MNAAEFRDEMYAFWKRANQEALDAADPFVAHGRLHQLYDRFEPHARALADQVLSEWILSGDEALRFDAMVLSREFGIDRVVPALERLAARLEASAEPGAPAKRETVLKLAGDLTAADGS